MNPKLMDAMTEAGMYRSAHGQSVPVYPRHYRQFSVAATRAGAVPFPLFSDEQVDATLANGTNLESKIAEFMAYYWDRTGKTEPPRATFDLVYCYLLHYVFAPAWTEAHDDWREKQGLGRLGLAEVFDKAGELLLEVETPAELIQWVHMALDAGIDCLSPPTDDDVAELFRMQRTDRKPGS